MELDSEPRAIPNMPGVRSVYKRHLHHLYPLVVQAVRVAGRRVGGDEGVLAALREVLEEVGREFDGGASEEGEGKVEVRE